MTLWHWKAPLYSRVRRLPLLKSVLQNEIHQLRKLVRALPSPVGSHLDVGTGCGDSLEAFPDCKFRIHLDSSRAMLGRTAYPRKTVSEAEHLPFPNETFDLVSAIGLLEYIQDFSVFLKEAGRVLKCRGHLLFTSSPPVIGNRMRGLLGERIHCLPRTELRSFLEKDNWKICTTARTWLQDQWLVQKVAPSPHPAHSPCRDSGQ